MPKIIPKVEPINGIKPVNDKIKLAIANGSVGYLKLHLIFLTKVRTNHTDDLSLFRQQLVLYRHIRKNR